MKANNILFALPNWKQPELAHFKTGDKSSRLRTTLKAKNINAMQQEEADAFLCELPKENEQFHILSNGRFDYWNLIAAALKLCNCQIRNLFLSTWTINLPISREIVSLLECGTVKNITVWLNDYLKTREPHVWAFLAEHLKHWGGRLFSTKNHAKIAAWECDDGRCFVLSGSANLTANPRIEQNFVAQSKELYSFYVEEYKKIEPKQKS